MCKSNLSVALSKRPENILPMSPFKPFCFYSAYGLTIKSELVLPELPLIQPVSKADITISLADLSNDSILKKLQKNKYYWHGNKNGFHLHIAETADFYVTNGHTILVDTIADPSDQNVRAHLLGPCMGVLIQQRDILPLHASCISKGNECIIISGQSGGGKSTLAMALNKKGYPLLSDDICVIHFSKKNQPYVYPSFPQIKIGADSANALRVDTSSLSANQPKHLIQIENRSKNQKHNIKTMFFIEPSNKNKLEIEELQGSAKMGILVKNTYTPSKLITNLGKTKSQFTQCSILANICKVKRICRTESFNNLSEIVTMIGDEFLIV